jgi:hypothetical protein
MNKFHAMLSLLFDVNVSENTVITISRGFGGLLRPADKASDLKIDSIRFEKAAEFYAQEMWLINCDLMRDSGAWER